MIIFVGELFRLKKRTQYGQKTISYFSSLLCACAGRLVWDFLQLDLGLYRNGNGMRFAIEGQNPEQSGKCSLPKTCCYQLWAQGLEQMALKKMARLEANPGVE